MSSFKVGSVVTPMTFIVATKQSKPVQNILGGDFLSPGIYQVLHVYATQYRKLGLLPFTVSLEKRKLRIDKTLNPSIPLISTLWMFGHILLSALILLHNFFYHDYLYNSEEIVQTFALFYLIVLPSAVLALSFTISFTPLTAINVINGIQQLQTNIRGKGSCG